MIGWFYIAAGPLGVIGETVGLIQWLRGGGVLDLPIPLAAGLSGWAIGRGLLRGNHRAWRWARGIARLALAVVALMALMVFTSTGALSVSLPIGEMEVGRGGAALFTALMGAFWAWQIAILRSPEAKQAFVQVESEV